MQRSIANPRPARATAHDRACVRDAETPDGSRRRSGSWARSEVRERLPRSRMTTRCRRARPHERLLDDLHQPSTPRRRACDMQRPLGRIARTAAFGQKR